MSAYRAAFRAVNAARPRGPVHQTGSMLFTTTGRRDTLRFLRTVLASSECLGSGRTVVHGRRRHTRHGEEEDTGTKEGTASQEDGASQEGTGPQAVRQKAPASAAPALVEICSLSWK